ncbi:MAG: efflux RND transporter periplasmic adaptor subunit [Akkermansia sp.]|nr:efflux RND transporter periplasmic adaptor subunit [Akkermansia sp.]
MRITTCAMIMLATGASVLNAQMPGATQHVQVEKVTLGKDRIARRSIGHMEAIKSVDVKAAVEGFIQPPLFKEGDIITKGELLFEIDPTRYKAVVQQREAALEQIEAQIIYAQNRQRRFERLAEGNATSEEEAESARTRLEELKASAIEAQANLAKAKKDLEDCSIRAEITGRIGRINFSPGNYITRGESLVTIKQMDPIYVRFPLSQYDVNGIFRGPKEISNVADVRLTTANGRRYEHAGKIAIVDNILTGDSDTYTLWAEFANPDHMLTPRGIGALNVALTDTQQVCMVPLTAVHYDENGAYIYTVDETGKVARAEATVGSIQGRLQSVYSGVSEGQTIITDGAHKVRVGDTVIGVEAIHEDTAEQSGHKIVEADPIAATTTTVTTMQDPTIHKCHGARVEAIHRVELRPLVQGILQKQEFKEGDLVKAGDVLFRIDPTRYQAEVDAMKAQIARLDVSIADAKKKYERQTELLKRNATSKDDAESAKATHDELVAKRKGAEASLILAEDDLARCTIKAPMDGRIGRVFFSEGNYISDLKTPLATLVQLSPIYVRFFLSENEILSAYRTDEIMKNEAEVTLVTAKGTVHPEKGSIHFADNIIKTATDTQNLWAVFNNEGGKLQPGGVVTIRLNRKSDISLPAVDNKAILTDTSGRFVYTLKHGRANLTRILCGTTNPETGLTPVFAGLKAGDIVITGPLAEITDGAPVQQAETATK